MKVGSIVFNKNYLISYYCDPKLKLIPGPIYVFKGFDETDGVFFEKGEFIIRYKGKETRFRTTFKPYDDEFEDFIKEQLGYSLGVAERALSKADYKVVEKKLLVEAGRIKKQWLVDGVDLRSFRSVNNQRDVRQAQSQLLKAFCSKNIIIVSKNELKIDFQKSYSLRDEQFIVLKGKGITFTKQLLPLVKDLVGQKKVNLDSFM
ncbi:MAG: hypothetical protein WC307_04385 [Candidatus Nanoarchaeia archaeon]|jgi:hypothetical protein